MTDTELSHTLQCQPTLASKLSCPAKAEVTGVGTNHITVLGYLTLGSAFIHIAQTFFPKRKKKNA